MLVQDVPQPQRLVVSATLVARGAAPSTCCWQVGVDVVTLASHGVDPFGLGLLGKRAPAASPRAARSRLVRSVSRRA